MAQLSALLFLLPLASLTPTLGARLLSAEQALPSKIVSRQLLQDGLSVSLKRSHFANSRDRAQAALNKLAHLVDIEGGTLVAPLTIGVGPNLLNSYGGYFVELELGTPAQTQFVFLDTGSGVNWVTCSTCVSGGPLDSACIGPVFDASKSSTVNVNPTCLQCGFDELGLSGCDTTRYTAPRFPDFIHEYYDVFQQNVNTTCKFLIAYGNTFEFGPQYQDVLSIAGLSDSTFTFGCAVQGSGDLPALFGLDPESSSLQNVLARQGVIPSNTFALCYSPTAGQLFLGSAPSISNLQVSYVPVNVDGFTKRKDWQIDNPVGFLVNGVPVDPSAFGNPNDLYVVDSGTTITFLPPAIYDQVGQMLAAFAGNKFGPPIAQFGSVMAFELGDKLGPHPTLDDVLPFFPPLTYLLPSGATLTVDPRDYVELSYDPYLTGSVTNYVNTGLGTVPSDVFAGYPITIGATFLINHLAIFDATNYRIGFAPTDCDTLTAKVVPNSVTSACDPSSSSPYQCFNAPGTTFICCSSPCPSTPGQSPQCSPGPASAPTPPPDATTPPPTEAGDPVPAPSPPNPYNPPSPISTLPFQASPPSGPVSTRGPLAPCDATSNLPYQCFNSFGNASTCCSTTCPSQPSETPSCSVINVVGASSGPNSSPTSCDSSSATPNRCYNDNGSLFTCCPGSCPSTPGPIAACA